jgi:hypothetical protein
MGTPTTRLALRTEPAVSAHSVVPAYGTAAARPPELTPRSPEGKAATGRQESESACATDRAEAHSQRTCQTPRRRFRPASPGSGRPWSREPRAKACLDPPRERSGPSTDRGAFHRRESSRELTPRRPFANDAQPRGLRAVSNHALCAALRWLASTGGPTKSSGGEQRPRLAGRQPEPCRTAAPRTIST